MTGTMRAMPIATRSRTPITDGAYGKPWVYRAQGLEAGGENAHHDRRRCGRRRPNGCRSRSRSGSPRWAARRSTRAPTSPTSSSIRSRRESAVPYFSIGARDDLMQRRHSRRCSRIATPDARLNPVSSGLRRAHDRAGAHLLWAWDARPFPAFPALAEVWADAANCARALAERPSRPAPLDELVASICAHYGSPIDTGGLEGMVDGFLIDPVMPAREALEPLAQMVRFRRRWSPAAASCGFSNGGVPHLLHRSRRTSSSRRRRG